MISDQPAVGIWNLSDIKLERKVVAKVIDITNQVVAVGDIHMVIDDFLPKGLEIGNIIEFECARIDLW